jgi:hypothetical protein
MVSIQRVLYYRPFAPLIRGTEHAEGFITIPSHEAKLLKLSVYRRPCPAEGGINGKQKNKILFAFFAVCGE